LLFRLDPETIHGLILHLTGSAGEVSVTRRWLQGMFRVPDLPVETLGLRFRNPVGLAAGYDKDGTAMRGLAALGFGHIEIGTVTPKAQEGNPKPRVFRLIEDEGVINRMGFPGRGMEAAARALIATREKLSRGRKKPAQAGSAQSASLAPGRIQEDGDIVIGVNLGKNKDTPLERADDDYRTLLQVFHPLADYLVINISSPNTPGLRRLEGRERLDGLLGSIADERDAIREEGGGRKPVLVKLSPDLDDRELADAIGILLERGMDGVIATNTTLARDGLRSRQREEEGGLSGRPLAGRSEKVLEKVVGLLNGKLPVISAGGIMTPEDAKRRLEMGATLVQVYTGLVYTGPSLVRNIVQALLSNGQDGKQPRDARGG